MAASKWLNQHVLDCNCDTSITSMSARGHQIRTNNFTSFKKAKSDVHWKMAGAGGGIIGGAFLMRAHPVLGAIAMILGGVVLNDVAKDYKTGKKTYQSSR